MDLVDCSWSFQTWGGKCDKHLTRFRSDIDRFKLNRSADARLQRIFLPPPPRSRFSPGHTHEDGVAPVPCTTWSADVNVRDALPSSCDTGVRQFTTRPNFAGGARLLVLRGLAGSTETAGSTVARAAEVVEEGGAESGEVFPGVGT